MAAKKMAHYLKNPPHFSRHIFITKVKGSYSIDKSRIEV